MMESPIQLSEAQKQEYYKEKLKAYTDGLLKLQEETGIMMVAYLEFSPNGVVPKLGFSTLSKEVSKENGDNKTETGLQKGSKR